MCVCVFVYVSVCMLMRWWQPTKHMYTSPTPRKGQALPYPRRQQSVRGGSFCMQPMYYMHSDPKQFLVQSIQKSLLLLWSSLSFAFASPPRLLIMVMNMMMIVQSATSSFRWASPDIPYQVVKLGHPTNQSLHLCTDILQPRIAFRPNVLRTRTARQTCECSEDEVPFLKLDCCKWISYSTFELIFRYLNAIRTRRWLDYGLLRRWHRRLRCCMVPCSVAFK